ncbi:Uncharacterised protein [Bacteroides heparinolyticus]|uniref:Uncharacterized protein n=1 Tax=Prevotella heparinolytica TaxID=28113 RepID=A0A449I043_9BACE|nr:hypothetical protein [Bacteroides heparinolyticus]VFB12801.1 Uncharacterised protein [Bacteroides heparinolyticus]
MNIPSSFANLYVEVCKISDTDIPSGNGGINKEGYTYGELRHQPIIPELMAQITHPKIRQMAEECNSRNRKEGFAMYKVDGEYCFWELRVGPVVKTPSKEELLKILPERPVTASAIRAVTYEILRKEIALQCNMSLKEAAEAIGNQLDCAPHEDISGHIFMVPNWAHKWFRHRGYVAKILNGKE